MICFFPAVGIHINFICRFGIVQKYFAVIGIQALYEFPVYIHNKLRIDRVPTFQLCGNAQFRIFTAHTFGNFQLFVKPCVAVLFPAPALIAPERAEAFVHLGQCIARFIPAGLKKKTV